jgi:hypothetical protein
MSKRRLRATVSNSPSSTLRSGITIGAQTVRAGFERVVMAIWVSFLIDHSVTTGV